MKYCIDCRWYRRPVAPIRDAHEYARCLHPQVNLAAVSPVTGLPMPSPPHYCSKQRETYGECGPEGKLFEAAGEPELVEHFEPLTIGSFGVR